MSEDPQFRVGADGELEPVVEDDYPYEEKPKRKSKAETHDAAGPGRIFWFTAGIAVSVLAAAVALVAVSARSSPQASFGVLEARQTTTASDMPPSCGILTFTGPSRMVFRAELGSENSALFIQDMTGLNLLCSLTDGQYRDAEPDWSPDGSRIAFESRRGNQRDIFIAAYNGSGLTSVTNDAAPDSQPDWAPDGVALVFISGEGHAAGVFVINADGSGRRSLTSHPAAYERPTWSPDGQRILFASDRDGGQWDIYVMNSDGSSLRRLTDNPYADRSPAWSPDGTQIVYVVEDAFGNPGLFVMDADGASQRRLFTVQRYAAIDAPVWLAEGERGGDRSSDRSSDRIVFSDGRTVYVLSTTSSDVTTYSMAGIGMAQADWWIEPE